MGQGSTDLNLFRTYSYTYFFLYAITKTVVSIYKKGSSDLRASYKNCVRTYAYPTYEYILEAYLEPSIYYSQSTSLDISFLYLYSSIFTDDLSRNENKTAGKKTFLPLIVCESVPYE